MSQDDSGTSRPAESTGASSSGASGGPSGTDGPGGGLLGSPRFLAAAAVVVLLLVLAVVLAVIGPGGDGDTEGDQPRPGATSSTAPSESPDASQNGSQNGSACGLAPGDQQIPTTAPEADWELIGTVAAPTAPDSVGPADTRDGVRRCFARSPTGALFAAVNFVATTSDADLRAAAVRQLAARGAGRNAALKAATSDSSGAGGASSTKFQVAGFAVLNADERASAVELAFRANTGGLIRLPVSLRWEQGDWKVVLPPDGDLYAALGSLPDLTGYIPWSGA